MSGPGSKKPEPDVDVPVITTFAETSPCGTLDGAFERIRFHGFYEVHKCAILDSGRGALDIRKTRDEHNGQVWIMVSYGPQQFDSGHLGQSSPPKRRVFGDLCSKWR